MASVKTLGTGAQNFQKRNRKIPTRRNGCLTTAPNSAAGVESDLVGAKNLRVGVVHEANHHTMLRTAESARGGEPANCRLLGGSESAYNQTGCVPECND